LEDGSASASTTTGTSKILAPSFKDNLGFEMIITHLRLGQILHLYPLPFHRPPMILQHFARVIQRRLAVIAMPS
jgi:hypothetical protein